MVCKITRSGSRFWYHNTKLHRDDGPASITYHPTLTTLIKYYKIGYTKSKKYKDCLMVHSWYHNGKRHRIDGPALIQSDGYVAYYLEGVYLTEKKFKSKLKIYKFHMRIKRLTDWIIQHVFNRTNR